MALYWYFVFSKIDILGSASCFSYGLDGSVYNEGLFAPLSVCRGYFLLTIKFNFYSARYTPQNNIIYAA